MNSEKSLLKATLLVLAGFFCMAIMSVFLKAATLHASPLWINFFAYLVGLILEFFVIAKEGFKSLKTKHFLLHFCRAFFGVGAGILYILSLDKISLLNATLLFNTTPLFIPFFTYYLLKSEISLLTILSILIGFIGIIIIIRPTTSILDHSGDYIALGSGISLALAYTFIKMLTPTESNSRIIFYFFLLATLLQVPLIPYMGQLPSQHDLLFAICAGIAFFFAQWFIVKAYSLAEAAKIGIFQYTSILYVAILDWIIWNVVPTKSDFIGAFLVILAGTLIITSPLWQKTAKKPL